MSWNHPVVGLPPPPPQTSPNTGAREFGRSVVHRVPVSPTSDDQGPEQTLSQRHEQLVSKGDPGDLLPRSRVLNAGEIALFEAQVGEGRKLLAAWSGSQDRDRNLVLVDVVWQVVKIGLVVEAHGLLD